MPRPKQQDEPESAYFGLIGVGVVGNISDTPSRKRKQPLGFAPPKQKRPSSKRRAR